MTIKNPLNNVIMGTKVDNITAKPPIKVLPKITGEPEYGTTNRIVQEIYGNLNMLPTTLGSGQHVHMGFIMSPEL